MPTRLIAPTKYSLATAEAGCSSRHRYWDRPRLVADGVNTIRAPARPNAPRAPGQAGAPPALGEVPVVADVHADPADRGIEGRVAHVAGPEVELLPEAL